MCETRPPGRPPPPRRLRIEPVRRASPPPGRPVHVGQTVGHVPAVRGGHRAHARTLFAVSLSLSLCFIISVFIVTSPPSIHSLSANLPHTLTRPLYFFFTFSFPATTTNPLSPTTTTLYCGGDRTTLHCRHTPCV